MPLPYIIQEKWDKKYHGKMAVLEPAKVLSENAHLLPKSGIALDVACGLGGNALFLASQGFQVTGWDISPVAIKALDRAAREAGLRVKPEVCDLEHKIFGERRFDVIIVSRFLERNLCKAISEALKPGGLLYYQTFVRDKVADIGPNNPDFLLRENELLTLFPSLRVVVYREEGCIGEIDKGFRNEALLVAQRSG